jgi:hypothetical protein
MRYNPALSESFSISPIGWLFVSGPTDHRGVGGIYALFPSPGQLQHVPGGVKAPVDFSGQHRGSKILAKEPKKNKTQKNARRLINQGSTR